MTGMTTYMVGGLGGINVIVSPQTISPIYANVQYYQQFTAAGGTTPYTWALVGSLPSGLTLYSNGNVIGTTSTIGSYSFGIKATDSATPRAHTSTYNYSGSVTYFTYNVHYFLVGGGGVGGGGQYTASYAGGGGGAGGVVDVCSTGYFLSCVKFSYSGNASNTYKIIVGGGAGTYLTKGYSTYVTYCAPSLSSFGNIVATGGGGGGIASSTNGVTCATPGGSGGGGYGQYAAPSKYGNGASGGCGGNYVGGNSGAPGTTAGTGGGGGGWGYQGGYGSAGFISAQNGGWGQQRVQYAPYGGYLNPSFYPTASTSPGYGWFAGGGGGAGGGTSINLGGPGGVGGGGNGGQQCSGPTYPARRAAAGAANTGGGGGGGVYPLAGCGSYPTNQGSGGSGGSGIAILTVPTAYYPGSAPGATVLKSCAAPGTTILVYTGTGTYKA